MADVEISGKTITYGIIGDPVEHSLSPLFQARFAELADIDIAYLPFHVLPEQLPEAISGLHALGIEGFNITVPHKETALSFVSADDAALQIGAVNTVRRSKESWQACNTDWLGFAAVLQGMNCDITGQTVLVLGAGGTSRAVVHALQQMGVGKLLVCNRGRERLQWLLNHVHQQYPGVVCDSVAWEDVAVREASESAPLLVNTTSVGIDSGNCVDYPFTLSGAGVAVDVVYSPDGETPFLAEAGKAGRATMDGLPMLVAQGAESFRFWHHKLPDRLDALRWLEVKLGRKPAYLPGWEVS